MSFLLFRVENEGEKGLECKWLLDQCNALYFYYVGIQIFLSTIYLLV